MSEPEPYIPTIAEATMDQILIELEGRMECLCFVGIARPVGRQKPGEYHTIRLVRGDTLAVESLIMHTAHNISDLNYRSIFGK